MVRETSVSHHNGGQLETTIIPPQYDSTVMYKGIQRGPHSVPHDAERRDKSVMFFQRSAVRCSLGGHRSMFQARPLPSSKG